MTPRERHTRLKIAFVLAGHGSAARLAAEHDLDLSYMLHCVARARKGRKGAARFKSPRIEEIADRFIAEQFGRHAEILQLHEASVKGNGGGGPIKPTTKSKGEKA